MLDRLLAVVEDRLLIIARTKGLAADDGDAISNVGRQSSLQFFLATTGPLGLHQETFF